MKKEKLWYNNSYMKKKFVVLIVLGISSLSAALPPFAENKRELEAILSADELKEYIPYSDVLESIQKTDTGYTIKTNRRTVFVEVHYLPQDLIGPAKFSLEFHL